MYFYAASDTVPVHHPHQCVVDQPTGLVYAASNIAESHTFWRGSERLLDRLCDEATCDAALQVEACSGSETTTIKLSPIAELQATNKHAVCSISTWHCSLMCSEASNPTKC